MMCRLADIVIVLALTCAYCSAYLIHYFVYLIVREPIDTYNKRYHRRKLTYKSFVIG